MLSPVSLSVRQGFWGKKKKTADSEEVDPILKNYYDRSDQITKEHRERVDQLSKEYNEQLAKTLKDSDERSEKINQQVFALYRDVLKWLGEIMLGIPSTVEGHTPQNTLKTALLWGSLGLGAGVLLDRAWQHTHPPVVVSNPQPTQPILQLQG